MSNLKQIERQSNILDWIFIGVFLSILIACFFAIYRLQTHTESEVVNVLMALLFTFIVGFLVINIMKMLDKLVRRHWITSYYIEEFDDVIKVVGAVNLSDWEFVSSKLLKIRKNYMLVNDAYERFGCTMAAVPASDVYLNARKELAAHGFLI